MKRLLLAAVLLSAPLSAWAACTHSVRQAMTCIEGHVRDPAVNGCVPVVTG